MLSRTGRTAMAATGRVHGLRPWLVCGTLGSCHSALSRSLQSDVNLRMYPTFTAMFFTRKVALTWYHEVPYRYIIHIHRHERKKHTHSLCICMHPYAYTCIRMYPYASDTHSCAPVCTRNKPSGDFGQVICRENGKAQHRPTRPFII